MTSPLYHFDNSRHPEQRAVMERLAAAGDCLFCDPARHGIDSPIVVAAFGPWVVVHNRYPYARSSLHLLLIPRQHVTDLADLDAPTAAALPYALRESRRIYRLTSYSIGVRCGDMAATGATIAHLHLHLVVGDPRADRGVRFRMSTDQPTGQETAQ